MKNIRLTLALLCFCSSILSAQVTLKGKISNIPASAIQVALVDYWAVDHWQQLAILQLENGGMFSVSVVPPAETQCRIRMAGQLKVWSDFVLPAVGAGADTALVFELDMKAMDGRPARIPGSAENERYFPLMSAYHNLSKLRDSIAVTPPEKMREAEHQFKLLCNNASKMYPGTFTGDIVANLLFQVEKADYTKDPKVAGMSANDFMAAHALDPIPFRYDRILHHNAFMKALTKYYSYFETAGADAGKNYIDGIMGHRNGNEAVDVFVFKYLLDKMLEEKNEGGLNHLLTWYLPDCSDESPLPDNTRTLVLALQNCTPGKLIPEQQMPGLDDKKVSLSAVCAKNKITLVYFWRSNCSHCKEFKPVLSGIYEKFHPQGVEVLAVSLDKTDQGWKDFLQREPNKWVNVFSPSDQRLDLNKLFPIPSTPTLIALDSKRNVLSRLILREQLEAYLTETLAKLNGK